MCRAGTGQEKRPVAKSRPAAPPARHVPRQDLLAYLEFDGLDAHADAWRASAAYKLLSDTKLGPLLEDLALQGIELIQESTRPSDASVVPRLSVSSNTSPTVDLPWE